MNKYQENLELMMERGINELEFLEKRIYDHSQTADIVLSEVAKSYNYYKYLSELFYVEEDELTKEADKQLHEDYKRLLTQKGVFNG